MNMHGQTTQKRHTCYRSSFLQSVHENDHNNGLLHLTDKKNVSSLGLITKQFYLHSFILYCKEPEIFDPTIKIVTKKLVPSGVFQNSIEPIYGTIDSLQQGRVYK